MTTAGSGPTSRPENTCLNKSLFSDPAPLTLGTSAVRYSTIRGFGTVGGDAEYDESAPAVAVAQTADGWKLVWADEFDKEGRPDPAKWTFETGFVRNQEAQWYQPENAWCEKGLLIVAGRRERRNNPNFVAGSTNWKTNREFAAYTSASLTTKGIKSWLYGRFEMRAKIDTRGGPAARGPARSRSASRSIRSKTRSGPTSFTCGAWTGMRTGSSSQWTE